MEDYKNNDTTLHEARKKLAQIINTNFDNQDSFEKRAYANPPFVREHNTASSPKENKN
ncbi:MAG: hypothetical protein AB9835_07555 [Eubacteriales bacterium]